MYNWVFSKVIFKPPELVSQSMALCTELKDNVERKATEYQSKLLETMEKDIYSEYFKFIGYLGGFPFDPNQLPQTTVSKNSTTFLIYNLTRVFLLIEVTFQFLRFIHSILKQISIFTIITQSVWVSVSITVTNVILTLNNYEDDTASLISSWTQLQTEIREYN